MRRTTIPMGLLTAIILLSGTVQGASDPKPVMRQAIQVYQQGEYERSAALLEGLAKTGFNSAPLFYNLGNCYYQTGQLGKAVLNFERAALLQPGNKKIRHNLRLARSKVAGEPIAWPEFSPSVWWGSLRGALTSNAWTILGLVSCWAGLACWLLGRRAGKAWALRLTAWTMAFVTLMAWLLAFSATCALASDYSIVMPQELEVLVGPDAQSGVLSTVYEGWKVRRMDRIGEWIKVELPDGQEGWLQKEAVEDL